MYPSMQWLWYGLGQVLPHEDWVPSLLMVIVGCSGIALLVVTFRALTGPRVAWFAGLLLALHPIHAAWSSSAYNVILPFSLGMLGWAAAALYVGQRRPREKLLWLCFMSLALAISTRLDSVVLAGPPLLWLLCIRPKSVTWKRSMTDRLPHLGAGIVTGGLLWFCVHPLVSPAEVPGAGERALSFGINWNLMDVHMPFDGPLGLAFLGGCGLLGMRRWPILGSSMVCLVIGNHLLMSTFNDYADRHALMSHGAVVFVLAAGIMALWDDRRIRQGLLGSVPVAICIVGLWDMRDRFYGTDDRFNSQLGEGVWAELPRMNFEEASIRDGEFCGWIGESETSSRPGLSHFNLIDEAEERAHRSANGCLRWCADVQDWRWSSRSVRDRALRMMHLYRLEAVGVLGESDGFQCLVIEVEERVPNASDGIPDWLGPARFP